MSDLRQDARPRPTPSEYRCLEAIRELLRKNPWAPSYIEIAEEMGLTGGAIGYLIKGLERKGYVARDRKKPRSLTLLCFPESSLTVSTPISKVQVQLEVNP